ncbi:hypothetical protein SNEBB_009622 [Seison nebaliae]|nr:hypothetical protein SNEBB_009622 [Seison nebaliae]
MIRYILLSCVLSFIPIASKRVIKLIINDNNDIVKVENLLNLNKINWTELKEVDLDKIESLKYNEHINRYVSIYFSPMDTNWTSINYKRKLLASIRYEHNNGSSQIRNINSNDFSYLLNYDLLNNGTASNLNEWIESKSSEQILILCVFNRYVMEFNKFLLFLNSSSLTLPYKFYSNVFNLLQNLYVYEKTERNFMDIKRQSHAICQTCGICHHNKTRVNPKIKHMNMTIKMTQSKNHKNSTHIISKEFNSNWLSIDFSQTFTEDEYCLTLPLLIHKQEEYLFEQDMSHSKNFYEICYKNFTYCSSFNCVAYFRSVQKYESCCKKNIFFDRKLVEWWKKSSNDIINKCNSTLKLYNYCKFISTPFSNSNSKNIVYIQYNKYIEWISLAIIVLITFIIVLLLLYCCLSFVRRYRQRYPFNTNRSTNNMKSRRSNPSFFERFRRWRYQNRRTPFNYVPVSPNIAETRLMDSSDEEGQK